MDAPDNRASPAIVPNDQAPRVNDRELLSRFLALRDEEAFRLLVARHSGLVWSVCLRVLGCHQDREDVFQATFLKLVMHARKNAWQESVGGWLYKVAYRLALSARAARKRRREQGLDSAEEPYVDGDDSLVAIQQHDTELALHAALSELPPRDREAIVLCYLQHKSHEIAALEIGCSLAALNGRLQRGRRRLLRRLAGRGLSLTMAMVAIEKTLQAAPQLVPADLLEQTVSSGFGELIGSGAVKVSSQVSALCQGKIGPQVPTTLAVQSTAAVVCMAAFWLASSGALYNAVSSGAIVYASPQLLVDVIAGNLTEPDETSADLVGSGEDDAKGRQVLRSSSQRAQTLLKGSQKAYLEILGKFRALVAFHERPNELTLNRSEFNKNLVELEEVCEGEIKKLERLWHDLEQMPKTSDNVQGEHLKVARTALETVVCNLSDVLHANLETLNLVNMSKNIEPGELPIDWDVKETRLHRLADTLEASETVLNTVAANLPESPAAGQRAIIERNLVKLQEVQRDNRAWENIPWYSKTRLRKKVQESEVIAADRSFVPKDFEIEQEVRDVLQDLGGVWSVHQGKISAKGRPTQFDTTFEAISERKRNEALEQLLAVPGIKVISVERGKGRRYSWEGSITFILKDPKLNFQGAPETFRLPNPNTLDIRAIPAARKEKL